MALKAILDTLDGLTDEMKKEYKAGEGNLAGKFVLDVVEVNGMTLDNTTTLKSALAKERKDREKLAKDLKSFDGVDPEAAREAMAKVEEIKNFNPEQKVAEGIRAREEQLTKKHQKEIETSQTELKSITSQLEETLITNVAIGAITGAKGSVKLLLPHVKNSTRLRKTDGGKYVAEVVDTDGTARISPKTGSSSPMSVEELITEMRSSDDFASAFAASGASGSGADTGAAKGNNGSAGGQRKQVKTIDKSDQAAMNDNLEAIAAGEVSVTGL